MDFFSYKNFMFSIAINVYPQEAENKERKMDFTEIAEELESASLFEIYRLSCLINSMLDNPQKTNALLKNLNIGQEIQYFDEDKNCLIDCILLEKKKKKVRLKEKISGKIWTMPVYFLNLEKIDVSVNTGRKNEHNYDRNSFQVGEEVWFHNKSKGVDMYGNIIKLNPKRALIQIKDMDERWFVYYSNIHKLIEGEVSTDKLFLPEKIIDAEVID